MIRHTLSLYNIIQRSRVRVLAHNGGKDGLIGVENHGLRHDRGLSAGAIAVGVVALTAPVPPARPVAILAWQGVSEDLAVDACGAETEKVSASKRAAQQKKADVCDTCCWCN